MEPQTTNPLVTLRDGRAALRQLRSLADAGALMSSDFRRLLDKIEASLTLPSTGLARGGLSAVRNLRHVATSGALTDQGFDRHLDAIAAAFTAIMGPDECAPPRPRFAVIDGGRP